jgi:hypothetical protein
VRLKRRLPVVLGVLLVAATLFAVVQLRRHAPPEPARLLPGADAFLYINLKWVRTLNALSSLPPVLHEPEYETFIQETGFQFERDLDEAAFAVHYPASWGNGSTGGLAPQPRFSEVFVGKIQGERLARYLRKLAGSVDNYHGTDIYSIPLEGRTLRVAVLTVDSVAVSNHDDPGVIRGMVDRCHKLASPFGGPALLRQNYKSVPLASLAWGIAKVQPASSGVSFGGWSLLFQKPARVVVSARYLGALHLRAEAFTDNGDDAQVLTDRVSSFLSLFHAAESAVGTSGPDPDVKAFFDSLGVARHGDRAVLTASVPAGFLKKVLSEQQELAPVPSGPSGQAPAATEPAKHDKGTRGRN